MNFSQLIFRQAEEKDLVRIVEMLASDIFGKDRQFGSINNAPPPPLLEEEGI